jgi:hypothetical protein
MTSTSPYSGLPPDRYWRTAVSGRAPGGLTDLYRKRFELRPDERIATAGSCFAQHIARALRAAGYDVVDTEPRPRTMADATAERFGYGVYGARYGNIYHARRLRQLVDEVAGRFRPEDWIWEKDGRWYDALRPGVEPEGLSTPQEVEAHRAAHLRAVRRMLRTATLLVFTFGLTEAWIHRRSGTVFPTAPGTVCGRYDPDVHAFENFGVADVVADFEAARARIRRFNPSMRFLLTVSPVPLAATAEPRHVLVATAYSKAVLRAACGELVARHPDVDYFPSYEIVAGHPSRGAFYDETLRGVTADGVASVMAAFFAEHPVRVGDAPRRRRKGSGPRQDVTCEEAVLEAFAP